MISVWENRKNFVVKTLKKKLCNIQISIFFPPISSLTFVILPSLKKPHTVFADSGQKIEATWREKGQFVQTDISLPLRMIIAFFSFFLSAKQEKENEKTRKNKEEIRIAIEHILKQTDLWPFFIFILSLSLVKREALPFPMTSDQWAKATYPERESMKKKIESESEQTHKSLY